MGSWRRSAAETGHSGKIEQHADTITAIHRVRGDCNDAKSTTLKWRNGQAPEISILFIRKHSRFEESEAICSGSPKPEFEEWAKQA
jgi:replicative DNA helicase